MTHILILFSFSLYFFYDHCHIIEHKTILWRNCVRALAPHSFEALFAPYLEPEDLAPENKVPLDTDYSSTLEMSRLCKRADFKLFDAGVHNFVAFVAIMICIGRTSGIFSSTRASCQKMVHLVEGHTVFGKNTKGKHGSVEVFDTCDSFKTCLFHVQSYYMVNLLRAYKESLSRFQH